MKTHRILNLVAVFLVSFMGAIFALGVTASAQTELTPNLQALPAWNISLSNGLLSFNTTSWNSGWGPLELIAGKANNRAKKQKVYQRIYYSDGTYYDRLAGDFVWHKLHNHFHFEQYALYTLQPVDAPGASQRSSQKTTFCVIDTDQIDGSLGGPENAVYVFCNSVKQGMSVGWGDTYGSYLAGQSIDVSGLPSGRYNLTVQVDPQNRLLELNDDDNSSCAVLDINMSTSTVTVVENTECSVVAPAPTPTNVTVDSISPDSIPSGSARNVTITGSGFIQGMNVSFESGSGQTPEVSNVTVWDESTLTATVSVKKGGNSSDSYWDLRVGTGILADALEVVR